MYQLATETYEQRSNLAAFCACYAAMSDTEKRAIDIFLTSELSASTSRFRMAMDQLCTCCGSGPSKPAPQPNPNPNPEPDPNPGPNPDPDPKDDPLSDVTRRCLGAGLDKVCSIGPGALKAAHAAATVAANLIDDPTIKTAAFAVLAMLARIITFCEGKTGLTLSDVRGICQAAAQLQILTSSGVLMSALSVGDLGVALQALIACCSDPAIASAPLPAWYPKPSKVM